MTDPDTPPSRHAYHPERLDSGPGQFAARPYAVTHGRTEASTPLDMMSLVRATGNRSTPLVTLGLVHAEALQLCRAPISVAEVAAHLKTPLSATKVVLSDLIDLRLLMARFPSPEPDFFNDPTTMRAVIDGLRAL